MHEIKLTDIREAAQRLADAHRLSADLASKLENELADAIKPVYERHRSGIDIAVADEALKLAELQQLIDQAPNLFEKPRSLSIDGVRLGYRKQEDGVDFDSEGAVIQRIRALPDLAELAQVLIRTEEHLNLGAIDLLNANQRRRVGIRSVTGADQSFITLTDTDVKKLAKAIMSDAAKRQGEEDAPKKVKPKSSKRKEATQ